MSRSVLSATLIAVLAIAGLCTVVPAASAAVGSQIIGGWSPIRDVNNPHIQELGGWAVAEHERLVNDGLHFNKVVSGEQQVVAGMNYKLTLDVTNGAGKNATYGALVYEQVGTKKRQLISFNPAN